MKIKLTCTTGGYKFGDVVDTSSSKTIDDEIAKGLVEEGFATCIEETPAEETPVEKPRRGRGK